MTGARQTRGAAGAGAGEMGAGVKADAADAAAGAVGAVAGAAMAEGMSAGAGASDAVRACEGFLRAPQLESAGVPHGFGTRGSAAPPGVRRARQVHGARVLCADDSQGGAHAKMHGAAAAGEADALYATQPGVAIGVVTADCVPILLAALSPNTGAASGGASRARGAASGIAGAASGEITGAARSGVAGAECFVTAVAAIHAGWRGLAAGVIEAGVSALRRAAPEAALCAAIGPHIGLCCYEVDAPVIAALFGKPAANADDSEPSAAAFGANEAALRPTRPGHYLLDLGALAQRRLARAGVPAARISTIPRPCTRCAPHFASYRRDGPQAGRMTHWVAVPQRMQAAR